MKSGIIVKGIGGFYYVKTDEGIIECRAQGKFRNKSLKPMIGDKVDILISDDGTGSVTNIYERKNEFVRPPVANVDQLILVVAAKNPEPDLMFIDKMTVIANHKNVELILCINKMDIGDDETCRIKAVYEDAGFKVIETSATHGIGIEDVKEYLSGKITAFAGFSGVGKSTILNAITDANAETGEISKKLKRGKHTTRHVELFEYGENSYIMDTPGFSMLDLPYIKVSELENYFPEFKMHIGNCKFAGCTHTSEPGCSIKEAVDVGDINSERYNHYVEFFDKLKNIKEWEI